MACTKSIKQFKKKSRYSLGDYIGFLYTKRKLIKLSFGTKRDLKILLLEFDIKAWSNYFHDTDYVWHQKIGTKK